MEHESVSTGIVGLDAILHGGIRKGKAIIVEGDEDSGLSALAVHFLASGAFRFGQSGLWISPPAPPRETLRPSTAFCWPLPGWQEHLLLNAVEVAPQMLLEQLKDRNSYMVTMLERQHIKRVVIGGFSYGDLSDPYEDSVILYAIARRLSHWGITSLLLVGSGEAGTDDQRIRQLEPDGWIRLTVKEHIRKYKSRYIEVLHMNEGQYEPGEHIFFCGGEELRNGGQRAAGALPQ